MEHGASGRFAVRWGEPEPPPEPRRVTAGPLAFDLCGADVENLRYGGVDVLRALRMVVRDRNWGTVPGRVERLDVSGAAIDLRVRHRDGEVDFAWTGRIEASADGLTAWFEGEALREFARNRIGWCLLHPLSLAGTAVHVETPGGEVREGAFPERISPHQPLRDIRGLRYAYGGATVAISFEGDVFETEDQRNWTDASYKTYGTPLDLPFPVTLRRGDRVSQRVTVRVTGDAPPAPPPAPGEHVIVGEPGRAMPPIGLTVPGPRTPLPAERALIEAASPGFLHVELNAADAAWRATLNTALAEAARLGVPLRAAVVAPGPDTLSPLLAALRDARGGEQTDVRGDVRDGVPAGEQGDVRGGGGGLVEAVAVFDAVTHVTTPELARVAVEALRGAGIRVGGGARAHFAELNRAADLPLRLLDEVGYSIAAEMHATDRANVRETLTAQPDTVRDARRIAGGRPVVAGPVGFRPRFNAVATGEPVETPDGTLSGAVDPRQASVFGAAWTVGTLAALADADAIVLYETLGRRGIAESADAVPHPDFPAAPGAPYPLHAVLSALAPVSGGRVRTVRTPPGIAALAVHADAGDVLLVANLRDTPADVTLTLPDPLTARWLIAADPEADRGWSTVETGGGETLRLPAPSVAVCAELRREGLHV